MTRLRQLGTVVAFGTVLMLLLSACSPPTASQLRMLQKVELFSEDLLQAVRRERPQLTPTEREWLDFTVEEVSCAVAMHIITEEEDPRKTLDSLGQAYRYEAAAKQKIKFAVLGKAYLRLNDLHAWLEAYGKADTAQQKRLDEQVLRRCILNVKP